MLNKMRGKSKGKTRKGGDIVALLSWRMRGMLQSNEGKIFNFLPCIPLSNKLPC